MSLTVIVSASAEDPYIFNRASKLFIQKYKYPEFCEYFDDIWLKKNSNW